MPPTRRQKGPIEEFAAACKGVTNAMKAVMRNPRFDGQALMSLSSLCTRMYNLCMENGPNLLNYGITPSDLTVEYEAYHPNALTGERYKVTLGTHDGAPALKYPIEANLPLVTDIEQVMSVVCSGRGGNVSIDQAMARTAKDAIFERVPLRVLEMCSVYRDELPHDDYTVVVANVMANSRRSIRVAFQTVTIHVGVLLRLLMDPDPFVQACTALGDADQEEDDATQDADDQQGEEEEA